VLHAIIEQATGNLSAEGNLERIATYVLRIFLTTKTTAAKSHSEFVRVRAAVSVRVKADRSRRSPYHLIKESQRLLHKDLARDLDRDHNLPERRDVGYVKKHRLYITSNADISYPDVSNFKQLLSVFFLHW
jgi:hypothetical protein